MVPLSSLAIVLLSLSSELCDFSVPRDFRDVSRELPACVIVMRTYTCIARQHKLFTVWRRRYVFHWLCRYALRLRITQYVGFGSDRQGSATVVTCCKLALYIGVYYRSTAIRLVSHTKLGKNLLWRTRVIAFCVFFSQNVVDMFWILQTISKLSNLFCTAHMCSFRITH